jgi:predicted Zn-dependent protease
MGNPFPIVFSRLRARVGGRVLVMVLLVVLGLAGAAGAAYRWGFYDLRAAQLANDHHHLAEAREHLDRCLRLWPHSTAAHFLAAQLARRAEALDEAERHLEACERGQGQASEPLKLERILLRVQSGDISADAERYLAERYMSRDAPETPLVLEALAAGYFKTQALPAALECLNRCLDRQPDNVPALFLRGRTEERLSRPQALDDYRRVVELEPGHRGGRLRLAERLLLAGRAEEAEGHFQEATRRWPEDAAARLGLARCRYHAGRAEEAHRLLDALVVEDPHNLGALKEQGRLALEAGRGAEAESWVRRALPLEPSDRETHHLLVQALQQQGKAEEARRAREESNRLAADLIRLQEILNGEMSRRPRDPTLLCELATLYLRYHKDEEGLRCLRRALELAPGYAPAQQALAEHAAHRAEVPEQ